MKKLIMLQAVLSLVFAAWVCAAVVELSPTYKRSSAVTGYAYQEVIADAQTGDDVRIMPMGLDGTRITCTIIAGAGSGKVQFTTSPDAMVIAQTAVWQDWPLGSVTGTTSDALTSQVTGLRGVSVSGEVTFEIVY